jgi:hypothetical protein
MVVGYRDAPPPPMMGTHDETNGGGTMKRMILGGAVVLGAAFATGAAAQEKPKFTVGADAAVVPPMGDWGDIAGIGFGGLARLEYAFADAISLTGRIGYIHHLPTETGGLDLSTTEIPVLAGAKYMLGSAYVAGEVGMVNFGAEACLDDKCSDDSETKLGLTAGAGYRLSGLDLRAQLFVPSLGDLGDIQALMATVGYDFASF